MSSSDTDSSHSDTDSNDSETMEESTALYNPPQLLPNYSTFLNQLQHVDIDTLPPNEECPICRLPYSTSLAEFSEGGENLFVLKVLPFYHGINNDCPVRLPCAFHHVVGRACMIEWTTTCRGTFCPMDRQELFKEDSPVVQRSQEESEGERWEHRRQNIEMKTPIRELLRCFRETTDAEILQVDAKYMCDRLATLLIRIVYRIAGIRDPVPGFDWPLITREYPDLGRSEESNCFKELVQDFIRDEPLTASGTYPPHIITLLDPTLPHIFTLLYRLAQLHEATSVPATRLASSLRDRMNKFFTDFHKFIPNAPHFQRIASLTIDTWVAQELLTTRLRRETHRQPSWFNESHPNSPRLDLTVETDADVRYLRAPDLIRFDDGVTTHRLYGSPRSLDVAGRTAPALARIRMLPEGEQDSREGMTGLFHVPDQYFNRIWDYIWNSWPQGAQEAAVGSENVEETVARVQVPSGVVSGGGNENFSLAAGPQTTLGDQEASPSDSSAALPEGMVVIQEIVLSSGRVLRSERMAAGNRENGTGTTSEPPATHS